MKISALHTTYHNICKKISYFLPSPIKLATKNLLLKVSGVSSVDNINAIPSSPISQQSKKDIAAVVYNTCNYCNSRCTMCNMWKDAPQKHLDVQEFEKVLRDPVFENLQLINFAGGEPSLVKNLEEYFEVALRTLPNLSGILVTTNGFAVERLKKIASYGDTLCFRHNKFFELTLSIDAYGETHDQIRGVNGLFSKNLDLIKWLKQQNIRFSLTTTIIKTSVWNLDKFLSFLRDENIYSKFRIGGFIYRLSNLSNTNVIMNFDADEIYQLQLFFYKLIFSYETNVALHNVFKSFCSVLSGGERLVDCTVAGMMPSPVWIDFDGGLISCTSIPSRGGNLLKESGESICERNYQDIQKCIKSHCHSCIRDISYGIPTERYAKTLQEEQRYREIFTVQKYFELREQNQVEFGKIPPDNRHTVFITGWYGTETVGDKAILGGIIDEYKSRLNDVKIKISSLYPFITERTIFELGIEAEIIPVYSTDFFIAAASADETIVGGGPLMELEELSIILWAFKTAKRYNKQTRIFGCGIGPLYSPEKTDAVAEILRMADVVALRDAASQATAQNMVPDLASSVIDDPSIAQIVRRKKAIPKSETVLACFLRELTTEYRAGMNYDEFTLFKEKFEVSLAENIRALCLQYGLTPHLYAMHNFVVGNDDRDFNYAFADKMQDLHPYIENKLSTIESVTEAMQQATLNVCMRFHSVVFAHTLEVPFIAVDYTSGGKIHAFMSERGKMSSLVAMADLVRSENSLTSAYADSILLQNSQMGCGLPPGGRR